MDIPGKGMASSVLNLGAFSSAEQTAILATAKAEYLGRITTGKVKGGGSSAQQYQMDVMSIDQLVDLINALTTELGLDCDTLTVRPDFNVFRGRGPFGSTFGAGGGQG